MGLAAVPATTGAKTAKTASNPLALWSGSIHATATNRVTSQLAPGNGVSRRLAKTASLGPYTSLRKNGCLSCHTSHNSAKVLLRASDDQSCLTCHNGGTNVAPAAPNIYAEMTAPKISHAVAAVSANNSHSAHESELLNHNRHANCVDCHNPHGTKQVGLTFPAPPLIRPSQNGVDGISATDGKSVLSPAVNQYENCLRCHGTSTGKTTNASFGYLQNWAIASPDPLNIIPEFSLTSTSSHPVMHDRSSPYPQPSLRPNMIDLDGARPDATWASAFSAPIATTVTTIGSSAAPDRMVLMARSIRTFSSAATI